MQWVALLIDHNMVKDKEDTYECCADIKWKEVFCRYSFWRLTLIELESRLVIDYRFYDDYAQNQID